MYYEDPKDPKDPKDLKDLKDLKDPKDPKDPKDLKDPKISYIKDGFWPEAKAVRFCLELGFYPLVRKPFVIN
jgi:hypothetical protein